jgi:allantoinase
MSEFDLIVRGGTLVNADHTRIADIGVKEGKISALGENLSGSTREEIDATGLYVFPGLIDAHVHFNEPGRTEWEGLATGSRALAANGVTGFIDMPLNSTPPVTDGATFEAKKACAERESIIDFGLCGGMIPGNARGMIEQWQRGALAFKTFMCFSGIEDYPWCDDAALYDGMKIAADLGAIVSVHAENHAIVTALTTRAKLKGDHSAAAYEATRPPITEVEAIQRALLLASHRDVPLHILHVSSREGITAIREAKTKGINVSAETCPHYLIFELEDVEALGPVAKCAPPIRGGVHREALWTAIEDRTLDMIVSDHSPSPPELKAGKKLLDAWGGIPGCQFGLPAMLEYGYHRRGISLNRIVELYSTRPAQRFNLAPAKGTIAVGADADLALVDIHRMMVPRAEEILYRHKQSPYLGRPLRGTVVRTILRGRTVFVEGHIVEDGRRGQMMIRH